MTTRELQIAPNAMTAILAHAAAAHPRECCGILTGGGDHIHTAIPTANIHPAPHTHFEIDPQALIDAHRAARAGGPQVMGYYHSHPAGAPEPSATDRALAAADGAVWAIAARGQLRLWRSGAGGFTPIPYRVLPG